MYQVVKIYFVSELCTSVLLLLKVRPVKKTRCVSILSLYKHDYHILKTKYLDHQSLISFMLFLPVEQT